MKLQTMLAFALVVALSSAAACGDSDEPAPTDGSTPGAVASPGAVTTPTGPASPNLFANPSFEEGEEPWVSLTTPAWGTPFSVSKDAAHTGQQSALLEMTAGDQPGSKVFGVVHEVRPQEFPEVISGYYRIGEWTRATDTQYLQFVVIVFDAENSPITRAPNYQIRYILAGIDQPPIGISNAKFVYVGTEEPVPDDWVYFEQNVRQDFTDQWGAVPERFSKIRILFEVRYDGKDAGVSDLSADVFYDDLYLGPAEANPNTP